MGRLWELGERVALYGSNHEKAYACLGGSIMGSLQEPKAHLIATRKMRNRFNEVGPRRTSSQLKPVLQISDHPYQYPLQHGANPPGLH